MRKVTTAGKILAVAGLEGNNRDLLRRWLTDDQTRITVDGEKFQPAKYVEQQSAFADLSDDDTDPITLVLAYFAKHREKIEKIFASLDAAADEKQRAEEAIKQSALAKLRAARAAAAQAEEEKREARLREQQEMYALQMAARWEAERVEEIAREEVTPHPKESKILFFDDVIRPTNRRERNLNVLLLGVSGLLGYADVDDLRTTDPSLYNVVSEVCSIYKWGKRTLIDLDWTAENIRDPSRAIFDKAIYPKLDSTRKARIAVAKPATVAGSLSEHTSPASHSSQGLSVHDFLIANAARDYTYNQIADEIGLHWKVVSQAVKSLVRDKESGVVRIERKTARGLQEVYRYAPARKEIDTGMTTTDEVLRRVILHQIEENAGESGRHLLVLVRQELTAVADHAFRGVLAGLVSRGIVEVRQGPRRAKLHFLAS